MNAEKETPRLRSVTDKQFASEVLHSNKPVLVAFSAPWSKPCHFMESLLLELASELEDGATLVKINADDNPHLSLWYGVQFLPTLLLFETGKVTRSIVGTASKEAILKLVSNAEPASPEARLEDPAI